MKRWGCNGAYLDTSAMLIVGVVCRFIMVLLEIPSARGGFHHAIYVQHHIPSTFSQIVRMLLLA